MTVLWWTLGLIVALAVGYAAVEFLPTTLAHTDHLGATKAAEEQGRIRTALVTLLAGIAAGVGAVYTARTFALNRRGQVTERFTRSVDQLGNGESLDVRLGGIYALGQLLRDSPKDHTAIIAILTAYAREHSPWQPPAKAEPAGADIQAIVTLLRDRDLAEDQAQHITIDLGNTNLSGIQGRDLPLADAHLSSSQLQDAVLLDAGFRGATLVSAAMEGTTLIGADLRKAVMWSAVLRDAQLERADLSSSELHHADLSGASYDAKTDWSGARYDARTIWPDPSFNPDDHGCVRDDRDHIAP